MDGLTVETVGDRMEKLLGRFPSDECRNNLINSGYDPG